MNFFRVEKNILLIEILNNSYLHFIFNARLNRYFKPNVCGYNCTFLHQTSAFHHDSFAGLISVVLQLGRRYNTNVMTVVEFHIVFGKIGKI